MPNAGQTELCARWGGNIDDTVDDQNARTTAAYWELVTRIYAELTVETNPQGFEGAVDIVVERVEPRFPNLNQDYSPGTGTTVRDEDNPAQWVYVAYQEPPGEKLPVPLRVTLKAKYGDISLGPSKQINVHTVFRGLASQGCQDEAISYCIWKYAPSVENIAFGPWYDPQTPNLGNTSIVNQVTVGNGAINLTVKENVCASVIGHENVHCRQSVWPGRSPECVSEMPAYASEIWGASYTGIDSPYHTDYLQECWDFFVQFGMAVDLGDLEWRIDDEVWALYVNRP